MEKEYIVKFDEAKQIILFHVNDKDEKTSAKKYDKILNYLIKWVDDD